MKRFFTFFLSIVLGATVLAAPVRACGGDAEKSCAHCSCMKNIPAEFADKAPTSCPGSCTCHLS